MMVFTQFMIKRSEDIHLMNIIVWVTILEEPAPYLARLSDDRPQATVSDTWWQVDHIRLVTFVYFVVQTRHAAGVSNTGVYGSNIIQK